ncbi:hypothetical protein RCL1_005441 [Eukaryota sp. TZLM3-RCL]
MQSLFALQGPDFVLVAGDNSRAQSILIMKSDDDKITDLGNSKVLLVADDGSGDGAQFTGLISANSSLYTFRNGYSLSTNGLAHYVRRLLADRLRKGPLQVSTIVAGFDEGSGGSLYWVDYLASMQQLNYAAHGYCSNFLYSIFDRYWKQDLTVEEGMDIMKKCVAEIHKRFLINSPSFTIKLVSRNGVTQMPLV